MSSFYFKKDGNDVFAKDVDVKRLARNIFKSLKTDSEINPPKTIDAALDLVAKALGAQNYHDMRQQAKEPDISSWDIDEVQRFVWENAVSNGMALPQNLPPKFNKAWVKSANKLFSQAVNARTPGKLEIVALVGASGSGKSIFANHLCNTHGGKVIDIELSIDKGMSSEYPLDSVLVYDRPAKITADRPSMGALSLWMQGAPAKRTLKKFKELARVPSDIIPGDEPTGFMGIRDWVRNNPQAILIVCFANLSQVQDALKSHYVVVSDAEGNWRRALVVDLDSMKFETIDGPGIQMEEGKYIFNLNE